MKKIMEVLIKSTPLLEDLIYYSSKDNIFQNKEKTQVSSKENNVAHNLSKQDLLYTDIKSVPLLLTHLNLSHNKLNQVPNAVLKLEHLQELDLSFNLIEYFDTTPNFCFILKCLNLSNNNLLGPPYWVWLESPKNLMKLDLSNNQRIAKSLCLNDGYFQELLEYKCMAQDIKIHNCNLLNNLRILSTFVNVRQLQLGEFAFSYKYANKLSEIPSSGLEECCELEYINLSNTFVYSMNANIKLLSNLVEIDLSQNKLTDLPNEFCELKKLEVCIFSHNYLMYLPDNIVKLSNLRCLKLNSNDIYMLPENISQLRALTHLDLYENALNEVPEDIYAIQELDLAQNYFDEPDDKEYLNKRDKLRSDLQFDRVNGKRPEPVTYDYEHSPDTDDDKAYVQSLQNTEFSNQTKLPDDTISNSSEDWDSDEYWIPHGFEVSTSCPKTAWLCFVKCKMAEGNFCPMDAHTIPISDLVRYEQLCNPPVIYESDGQFDDFSDDDS